MKSHKFSTTGWRSLTVQLITLIVLPLTLIVLAVTVGSTTLHQNAMRDLVGERDERVVQMAAQAIENQISTREYVIRGLALQSPIITDAEFDPGNNFQSLRDRYAYADPLFDVGLFVVDQQGNILAARGPVVDLLRSEREAFLKGINDFQPNAEGQVFITAPFALAESGRTASIILASSEDQKRIFGGVFFVDGLADQSLSYAFPPDQPVSVLLMEPGGEILYQKGFSAPAEDILEHAGVQESLMGRSGRVYTEDANEEHVVAFTSVERMNWGLLIEEPWEQVASPLLETTHLAPLAMIPVMLLALFALLFAFRQIVRPLRILAKQAGNLGWGDYTAIEQSVGGIEEIRFLQSELIHMSHKVRAAQRSLHNYIGAITSGQEDERRRLSRELHDETIQSLISFKQTIQLVEMDHEDQPVAAALNKLEAAAEQTIEDVRRMVRALRPIYLEDLGLVAALNMLVNETAQASGISIGFDHMGKERRLDPAVELALYRIVQEALNNISRHSGASRASVTISYDPTKVNILVVDNGKGFRVPISPAEFAPGGHFGLLGMYERTELIGGSMQMQSAEGEGTRLVIEVKTGN